MHGGTDPSGEPATAAAAVAQGARAQLRGIDPRDPDATEELERLLVVTEDLLARATFDDSAQLRRAAADGRLDPGLRGTTSSAELADRIDTLDVSSDAVREAVAVLRECELGTAPTLRQRQPRPPAAGTSADALADYLRTRGELVAVDSVAGGFSKETLLVSVRGQNGVEDLALRKVAAGRVADSLAGEYAVLSFVAAGNLPVATPLWLDLEGGELGAALFVTSRMPGHPVGTVTGPSADATADLARQLATVLGRLHSLDVSELDTLPRPPTATGPDLLAAIEEREKVIRQVGETAPQTPGLALHRVLLAWLRTHLPPPDAPTVLVHGDVGFHNLLVADGELSALLDRELAHLGRPAEDLSYVRPSVEGLLPWPEFVEHYLAAGGVPATEAELRFFTVWQDVWRATSCLRLRTKFALDPSRLADGVSGLLLGARFLDSALQTAFGDAT